MKRAAQGLCFVLFSLLTSSCGYGPWLTCRTGCEDPKQERNFLCECEDKLPPGSGYRPQPPVYAPYLNATWESTPNCGLNRRYYVFNNHSVQRTVTVRADQRSGQPRDFSVVARPNAVTFETATEIGLELLEPDCFDQQFQMIGYFPVADLQASVLRNSTLLARQRSIRLKAALAANGLDEMPAANATYFNIRRHVPLDCQVECGDSANSTPTARCLKSTPPDQTRLKGIRDRLLTLPPEGNIPAAALHEIFGIQTDPCKREDIKASKGRLFSMGDACGYPVFLDESAKRPAAAIYIPPTVVANRNGSATFVKLSFSNPGVMPHLVFGAQDLEGEWGGTVQTISATKAGVFYETTGGCISLHVK